MADYIERENPYDKIGNAVEKWCKENMYTTMLVTISIGYEWETPHEETHLLVWDGERCELVWEIDWWEGQQHVAETHQHRVEDPSQKACRRAYEYSYRRDYRRNEKGYQKGCLASVEYPRVYVPAKLVRSEDILF